MTTYICKCGKTFQKNTEAATTGFRMPDYGPDHECYGCPFVCKINTWDPMMQHQAVQNHECRGSKTIQYDTQAALSRGDKCVGRIYSLDLEFLHRVRDFSDTLDGIEPDRYAFSDRPSDYGDDGRFKLTIYPAQNNKGITAKQRIFERFFNPDGSRVDVAPDQEKEIVLNQIKEAKALAQGKTAPAGMAYIHGSFRYFVDRREGNGKFTAFLSSPEGKMEVPTIGDFDTFEEAQNALDGFALKKHFEAETASGAETPVKSDLSSENTPAEAAGADEGAGWPEQAEEMNELAGRDDLPDSGNDPPTEQPPCDWKNASGADEEDDEPDDESPCEVSGPPVSLRGHELDDIVSTADNALNKLIATLHAKKQRDGEMTVKITFEDDGFGQYIFGGTVSGKINYTIKPQKISGEPIELKFDAQGNPVVPADRVHQLNFDEIQPGQREIPPSGGTATVDGKTGIVEHFEDNAPQEPTADVQQEDAGDDDFTADDSDDGFPSFEDEEMGQDAS